jgi:hypothetical protein
MMDYFIVRNIGFATNGNIKLLFTLISLFICSFGIDYLNLYLISTLYWATFEFLLQLFKIRKIESMHLYIFDEIVTLPIPIACLFQGSMEAGFITISALLFTRSSNITKLIYLLWIFLHTKYLCKKNITMTGSSRRRVTSKLSIIILSIVTIFDLIYLLPKFSEYFINMILIGSVWTIATYICGTRIVQDKNEEKVSLIQHFCVLTYDVIFEICCMYLPFFLIV